jgi:aminopeptidase N
VVRAGALAGMANSRDEGAVDSVTRATAYGVPTRARRAAVSALPLLSEGRAVREHLENLLDDSDPYLRISAISALRTLGDSKARHALRVHIDRELDGRVARRAREAVRDLGQTASEQKKLGDDLEAVRSQLAELKTRLSKLEAKPTQGEKGDQGPESSAKQATRPRKKATRSPKKPSKTRTKVAKSGRTTRKKAKSRKKGRGRS